MDWIGLDQMRSLGRVEDEIKQEEILTLASRTSIVSNDNNNNNNYNCNSNCSCNKCTNDDGDVSTCV